MSRLRFASVLGAVVFAMSALAGRAAPAHAAPAAVQIVEPSLLPQTWGFDPQPIVVNVGDTVTFTNTGVAPHTVTAVDASFDSPILMNGGSWTFTFTTSGEVAYYC